MPAVVLAAGPACQDVAEVHAAQEVSQVLQIADSAVLGADSVELEVAAWGGSSADFFAIRAS